MTDPELRGLAHDARSLTMIAFAIELGSFVAALFELVDAEGALAAVGGVGALVGVRALVVAFRTAGRSPTPSARWDLVAATASVTFPLVLALAVVQ